MSLAVAAQGTGHNANKALTDDGAARRVTANVLANAFDTVEVQLISAYLFVVHETSKKSFSTYTNALALFLLAEHTTAV